MHRRDAFVFAQARRVAAWRERGLLSSAALYPIAALPPSRGWLQAPLQPAGYSLNPQGTYMRTAPPAASEQQCKQRVSSS